MKNTTANATRVPSPSGTANERATPMQTEERDRREHLVGARQRGARALRFASDTRRLLAERIERSTNLLASAVRTPDIHVIHELTQLLLQTFGQLRSVRAMAAPRAARERHGDSERCEDGQRGRRHLELSKTSATARGARARSARTPPSRPSWTPASTSRTRTASRADRCPVASALPPSRSRLATR